MFPPLWTAERKKEWARATERVRGRDKKKIKIKREQEERQAKRNRNKENKITSQMCYYPIPAVSAACLLYSVAGGVLIHSRFTLCTPPSCYLWLKGTMSVPAVSPLLLLLTNLLWWNGVVLLSHGFPHFTSLSYFHPTKWSWFKI